jgi:hypothetical protein
MAIVEGVWGVASQSRSSLPRKWRGSGASIENLKIVTH